MVTDKITIAIPVYERIDFFEEALNSALGQTISCPVYVIDNASTHNKFRGIVQKKDNPLIAYIRNEKNVGMVENWNRCIDVCQTEYLSILHDDDVLHPGFVEHCLRFLSKNPSQKCCFAVSTIAGNDPSVIFQQRTMNERYKYFKKKYFLFENLAAFPGVLFPVAIAKKIGGFRKDEFSADFDFWIRLSECLPIIRNNTPYAFYRLSNQQETKKIHTQLVDYFYKRRLILLSNLSFQNNIYKFSYFFIMLKLYISYHNYKLNYKMKMNIRSDIKNTRIAKWFIFFRIINFRVLSHFYYRLFWSIFYRT